MTTTSSIGPSSKVCEHYMPFGAQILEDGSVLFRLWAPDARNVELCLENSKKAMVFYPMKHLPHGWFEITVFTAGAGSLYRFRINNDLLVPDPASRCQFADVHGPSIVVDPTDFQWRDTDWQGRPWEEAVIYELHPGTFSPAGTFAGIAEKIPYLAELGITAIELMPIADFPGRWNWGYDGALLFAPDNSYGTPNELKQLIETAHAYNLMVFLDVVYNHFGPEGNYLYVYAKDAFFTERHQTPWGAALNFAGVNSRAVRDFIIHNALYWLEEYQFDGLRLDAVHAIFDESHPDILEELATEVQNGPGKIRRIHLILENDDNTARYLSRDQYNSPSYFVAQWNDDFHHACHVLLTGEQTGYYIDYADNPLHHLGRCLTEGFAFQGEKSTYRNQKRRGEKSDYLPPQAFVSFLQCHDQIGNRAFGERLTSLVPEASLRLAISLVLLTPNTPLIFMGEEFGATTPFLFFCDFGPGLAEQVTQGRRREFAKFSEFSDPLIQVAIPDPEDIGTYQLSCLNWHEQENDTGRRFLELYKKLLTLRHRYISPRLFGMRGSQAHYRIIGPRALLVDWLMADGATLRLLVNFGSESVRLGIPLDGTILYSDPGFKPEAIAQKSASPYSILWSLRNRVT